MLFREVKNLILLQLKMELKDKNGIWSNLLYVTSSIFVIYLAVKKVSNPDLWIALFWIIQIFTCLNAATKSFGYSKGRDLYYHTLSSSHAQILSKIFFNTILMSLITLVSLGIYQVLLGNTIQQILPFAGMAIAGSACLASLLTMMSAISFKVDNNYTLLAILSLPLMIPVLVVLISGSQTCIENINWSEYYQQLFILVMLNIANIILSYILFPYLCRE